MSPCPAALWSTGDVTHVRFQPAALMLKKPALLPSPCPSCSGASGLCGDSGSLQLAQRRRSGECSNKERTHGSPHDVQAVLTSAGPAPEQFALEVIEQQEGTRQWLPAQKPCTQQLLLRLLRSTPCPGMGIASVEILHSVFCP